MVEEEGTSFKEAVFDMGQMFKDMKTKFGVPHTVTMDIVRLQMMFMQQNQQASMMSEPVPEDTDVNEVITPEDEIPALEVIEGGNTEEQDA